jgi:hypothetical protein
MTSKRRRNTSEQSARGGFFFFLAGVSLVAALVLALQHLPRGGDRAVLADAVHVAAPGSFLFTAERAARWTLVAEGAAPGALARLDVSVVDKDTGERVRTEASGISLPAQGEGTSLVAAVDVALTTPGTYQLVLDGPVGTRLLLLEDVTGRLARARRAALRAGGVAALGFAVALAFALLGTVVRRSRPRRRATAPRQQHAPATRAARPATVVPRGLQVTPAAPGRATPASATRRSSGLYRALPAQRTRSVFEEETEALLSPFTSDVWEVPTAA